jgi:hypothetical protein
MDQLPRLSSGPNLLSRVAAELALFTLWCGCAPPGPCSFTPAFALDGLVSSVPGVSLKVAAAILSSLDDPCWLLAGRDDLSASGAQLQVMVSREAPHGVSERYDAESRHPFRFPTHLVPPEIASDAPILVFGGHTRLRATPADMTEAQVRFGLVGPSPSGSAGPVDSPWAVQLLPVAERAGYEWAIMLGRSIAYDPPWNRDAV